MEEKTGYEKRTILLTTKTDSNVKGYPVRNLCVADAYSDEYAVPSKFHDKEYVYLEGLDNIEVFRGQIIFDISYKIKELKRMLNEITLYPIEAAESFSIYKD